MVVKVEKNNDANKQYRISRKAGRSIIDRRPVFSSDGESLAVIVEDIVRVYNVRTGEIVRTLEPESNIDELIAIEFPQNEDYNLYGCSSNGCVTIWTWDKGAVLREILLQLPPHMQILTFNLIDNNECFITAAGGSNYQNNIFTATYSVKTGALLHEYANFKVWDTGVLVKVSLGSCHGDRYAAIINGTKNLFIQSIYKPHSFSKIVSENELRIVSVAAHHSESSVVISDVAGRVTIIRGNLLQRNSTAREVLHWHCLPPLAVCFSVQGSYMYSGGVEQVLVKWTIGSLAQKVNEKAFIPRLPGMIRFVTTNSTHVAITLSNNSIVVANAQMHVVCTIMESGGTWRGVGVGAGVGGALVYHQQLGALLTLGRTGHLQLYSTTTDKVLYDIDITGMNVIQAERWNLLPLNMEVTCATISPNGQWLVTSEYRNDGITFPEEKLKFWSAQPVNESSPFKLNTCVNLSHGGCNVVSLALSYQGDFCVSAGTDQKFRIWKRENVQGKNRAWMCLTACYYSSGIAQSLSHGTMNNFKVSSIPKPSEVRQLPYMKRIQPNDIVMRLFNIHKEHIMRRDDVNLSGVSTDSENDMGGVAISRDGSLIAAWFGCKLTLWDTHLCSMRTSLSHPALRPKGMHVQFGNQDAAHYLVCTTQNCLAVWSLLSLTLKWLVQIHPTCLASNKFSNKMAVVTAENDIYIFTPHSSKPIMTKKALLDPRTGVIKQCTFGDCSRNSMRLYLMRNNSEVYCIEPDNADEGRLEIISQHNPPSSKFSQLIAEQRSSEVRPTDLGDTEAPNTEALVSAAKGLILNAPPHMIPPVSLLCTTFLQELSGQQLPKGDETEDSQENEAMDVEASSDEEDTEKAKLNGPYAPKVTELWTPNYEAVKEKKLNKIIKEPFLDLHSTSSLFGI